MSSLSSSLRLSSSLKEEVMFSKNQGIVSILGSDGENSKSASIRRTLSADMSSKKWQSQHGFCSVSPVSPAVSEGEEKCQETQEETELRGQFDIWCSIQEDKKKKKKEQENPGQFDTWSSILSQKAQEDSKNNLPPPYVHPLVKRSASSLSAKSLQICTESLGSETGSDGFPSYSPSEAGDAEHDKVEDEASPAYAAYEQEKYDMEDLRVAKYNLAAASQKLLPRSFPPAIPTLTSAVGSLHMRTRRDNGRLVLEAVSVASQNNFHAQRQDGRLVLSFINSPDEGPKKKETKKEGKNGMEQFELEIENNEHEEEEEEEKEAEETDDCAEETEEEDCENEVGGKSRFVMEQINFHRLALMMNRHMVRNPTWPNKVEFEEEEEEEMVEPISPLTQSLPPMPPLPRMMPSTTTAAVVTDGAGAASFNACEYYWKPKAMAAAAASSFRSSPMNQKTASIRSNNNNHKFIHSKSSIAYEHQKVLALRGKGCKEPRRSLLFWEPYCIATS